LNIILIPKSDAMEVTTLQAAAAAAAALIRVVKVQPVEDAYTSMVPLADMGTYAWSEIFHEQLYLKIRLVAMQDGAVSHHTREGMNLDEAEAKVFFDSFRSFSTTWKNNHILYLSTGKQVEYTHGANGSALIDWKRLKFSTRSSRGFSGITLKNAEVEKLCEHFAELERLHASKKPPPPLPPTVATPPAIAMVPNPFAPSAEEEAILVDMFETSPPASPPATPPPTLVKATPPTPKVAKPRKQLAAAAAAATPVVKKKAKKTKKAESLKRKRAKSDAAAELAKKKLDMALDMSCMSSDDDDSE
jgi:hypothetical protein